MVLTKEILDQNYILLFKRPLEGTKLAWKIKKEIKKEKCIIIL